MTALLKIGLVSVSDRASSGVYQDQGIPELQQWLEQALVDPFEVETRLIPDEQPLIEQTLKELVDEHHCHLVLTTGGTGPAKRDVTPDATLAVADREMPGFGEQMRQVSLHFVPTAILSRQVGVIRKNSLILNLPGQPKAIKETLEGVKDEQGKVLVKGIFSAVPYCLQLIDGIYIDTLNLSPRIQNQIRSLVAFDNPIFYKNNRLGYSNWNQPMVVYMGSDINDYIKIPRGLMEKISDKCSQANIPYEIIDKRERGKPVNVEFKGQLKDNQNTAANELLKYDNGILNATTAFGKTVVASYLISKRKVSTLIVMQSVSLINQWVEELHKFLDINEELPTYQTKTGIIKTRNDVIGVLYGNKNTLTGIIDVVSVNSIYDKNGKSKLKDSYGMVIVDECHHSASSVFENVLNKVNSKYVYGVSANDKRIDQLEKKVYMLIGSIRHQFTSRQRIEQQNIDHFIYPRFTRVINLGDSKQDINSAYSLIAKSTIRNEMIISDIKECIKNKRSPIVLTRYKEHAKYLYDVLKKDVLDNTFLIYGDNTQKKNNEVRKQLLEINQNESFILVATSQSVGEGFNVPRLDTLFLTTPVSGEPLVEQFLGRINRDYEFKESAIVYDYVDLHISFFNNMYKKRLRAYRKIGFDVITNVVNNKQEAHHIYNYNDYSEIFAQDIHESNKEIIVCSPQLDEKKIFEFIDLVKNKQEKGVTVIVITRDPNNLQFDNPDYANYLIYHLKMAGIIVELCENLDNHYAIIDQEIVWHGGINLLGRPDIYDNLIRLKSVDVASELLTLDKDE